MYIEQITGRCKEIKYRRNDGDGSRDATGIAGSCK